MKKARLKSANKTIHRQIMAGCLVAVILAGYLTQLVSARSRESFFTRNNIIFLESDGSLSSTTCQDLSSNQAVGEALSGGLSKDLMVIKNPDKFAQAIDTWVKKAYPGSPFVGLGRYAVMGGQRAGINPILPIIIARKESNLGTNKTGAGRKLTEGHNAYGRTATSQQPHIATSRKWYKWRSFEDSLFDQSGRQDDMYLYIKRTYGDLKTIDQTMLRYAPPSENNTDQYLREIKQWASEIYNLAGDAIDQSKLGSTNTYDDCVNGDGGGSGGGGAGVISLGNFNMFYQHKGPWARQYIGRQSCLRETFTQCGCGPTSLAIVISNLTGDKSITPLKTRDFASFSNGIDWASLASVPRRFGLKTQTIGLNIARARQTLEQGGLVILSQTRGPLTRQSDGHILVIRGINAQGRFLVADPISERQTNNQNGYSAADILSGARNMWAVTK